jgi:starch synthase
MKILIASSEAVPFAKTGGLADVCGALPVALRKLGHEPVVIMPAYRVAVESGRPIRETGIGLEVHIGSKTVSGSLLESHLPDSDVPVYLVQQDEYFGRSGIYGEDGGEYPDNCERFVFFCRSVIEAIRHLDPAVDVVHCNDWTTGLIPAYLKVEYSAVPGYDHIASLFTVHNLAYQGTFWHWDMLLTGLDWKYFNWHQMEFHGDLNLLKTGLVFADAISTVSPTYAREIQSAPLGCGLEGLLRRRSGDLSGIINGIDDECWNPATDKFLGQNYDAQSFVEGKAACKAALQKELGLATDPHKPLVGLIGRLAGQKGYDLVLPLIERWAPQGQVQWALLGTGEPQLEQKLVELAKQFPQTVAANTGFSESLAHRIEAGADIFVVPNTCEPCGLNQLYSLRYGTVPVVRKTGGLADTVTDTNEESLAAGTATGFHFLDRSTGALATAIRRACEMFNTDQPTWHQLVRTGMAQDFSWKNSARHYVELYERIAAARRSQLVAHAK